MISYVKNFSIKVGRIAEAEKGFILSGYKTTDKKSKSIWVSVFLTAETTGISPINVGDTVSVTGQLEYSVNRYNNTNQYIIWCDSVEKIDENDTTDAYITVGLMIDSVKCSTTGAMYKCFMISTKVADKPLEIVVQTLSDNTISGDKNEPLALVEGKFACKENFAGQCILLITADKLTYINQFDF